MSNQPEYPNSAILFRNDRRADNPKAPHAKGDGNIVVPAAFILERWDGNGDLTVPIEIGAWTREAKNGAKFQTLSIKPKGSRAAAPANSPESAPRGDQERDRDIPF